MATDPPLGIEKTIPITNVEHEVDVDVNGNRELSMTIDEDTEASVSIRRSVTVSVRGFRYYNSWGGEYYYEYEDFSRSTSGGSVYINIDPEDLPVG